MATVEYVPVCNTVGIFCQVHVDGRYWGALCYTPDFHDMTYLIAYLGDETATCMYIVNRNLAATIDKLSRLVCAPF